MSETTAPQLPQWITDHLQRYLDTDGADGHMWDSKPVGGPGLLPTLLLTTNGRRSGKPITMPLIYGEADGSYIIVASKGGAPQHPGWYLNLAATPQVEVQVRDKRFRATARTTSGQERTNLWQKMRGIYPPYDEYQAKTEREIPVVVLEPQGEV